jgi:hypothetical protein
VVEWGSKGSYENIVCFFRPNERHVVRSRANKQVWRFRRAGLAKIFMHLHTYILFEGLTCMYSNNIYLE